MTLSNKILDDSITMNISDRLISDTVFDYFIERKREKKTRSHKTIDNCFGMGKMALMWKRAAQLLFLISYVGHWSSVLIAVCKYANMKLNFISHFKRFCFHFNENSNNLTYTRQNELRNHAG